MQWPSIHAEELGCFQAQSDAKADFSMRPATNGMGRFKPGMLNLPSNVPKVSDLKQLPSLWKVGPARCVKAGAQLTRHRCAAPGSLTEPEINTNSSAEHRKGRSGVQEHCRCQLKRVAEMFRTCAPLQCDLSQILRRDSAKDVSLGDSKMACTHTNTAAPFH